MQDDTELVIHDLQQLRNVRYEDKPVSIYGGMVDLPLIVTEPEPVQYFDEATRAQVTGGLFWVEFEAGQAGGGRLARDLRQNLFGDEAWHRLDPATRTFVVTAERILGSSKAMAEHLGRTLAGGRWLAESLGPVLADFARYRNPAAHEAVAGRADAIRWRQRILGIGCEGVLARLAGVGAK